MASPGGSIDDEGEDCDEAETQSETDLLEIAVVADVHVSEFTAINMTAEKDEFLAEHNKYRCMHGAGNLVWNNVMASSAALWGQSCCQNGLKHAKSYDETPSSGENLAAGYGSIAAAIKGWYDEVKDCTTMPGCKPAKKGGVIGHFTAMVWSSSTELGCAVNPTGWMGRPVYVCRYALSAPNFQSQYQKNVFSKSKQESQCSGGSTPAPTPPAPTPPAPTPPAPSPTPPSNCKDANPTTIRFNGASTPSACSELGGFCSTGFVADQCGCTCGSSGGGSGGPAPSPAPSPSSGSGGTCCTCVSSAECSNGMFCCPWMKRCIPNSRQSCYTNKDCAPAR